MLKYILCTLILLISTSIYAENYCIINFTAKWCGPCQQMKNKVWKDQEMKKYLQDPDNNLIIREVDIDIEPDMYTGWKIKSVPTIIVVMWNENTKKWEEVDRRTGFMEKVPLLKFLRKTVDKIKK